MTISIPLVRFAPVQPISETRSPVAPAPLPAQPSAIVWDRNPYAAKHNGTYPSLDVNRRMARLLLNDDVVKGLPNQTGVILVAPEGQLTSGERATIEVFAKKMPPGMVIGLGKTPQNTWITMIPGDKYVTHYTSPQFKEDLNTALAQAAKILAGAKPHNQLSSSDRERLGLFAALKG